MMKNTVVHILGKRGTLYCQWV